MVDDFLQDLREAVETVSPLLRSLFDLIGRFFSSFLISRCYNVLVQVKANPGPITGGLAPIYGAAGKMPDRGMVNELLVSFMDSQY